MRKFCLPEAANGQLVRSLDRSQTDVLSTFSCTSVGAALRCRISLTPVSITPRDTLPHSSSRDVHRDFIMTLQDLRLTFGSLFMHACAGLLIRVETELARLLTTSQLKIFICVITYRHRKCLVLNWMNHFAHNAVVLQKVNLWYKRFIHKLPLMFLQRSMKLHINLAPRDYFCYRATTCRP